MAIVVFILDLFGLLISVGTLTVGMITLFTNHIVRDLSKAMIFKAAFCLIGGAGGLLGEVDYWNHPGEYSGAAEIAIAIAIICGLGAAISLLMDDSEQ
jgi:hypothetical protein